MSLAYSATVRSLENLPIRATFRIAFDAHVAGCRECVVDLVLRVDVGRQIGEMKIGVSPIEHGLDDPVKQAGLSRARTDWSRARR